MCSYRGIFGSQSTVVSALADRVPEWMSLAVCGCAPQDVILCFKSWAVLPHLIVLAFVLGLLLVVVLGCRVFTWARASVAGHIGFPWT